MGEVVVQDKPSASLRALVEEANNLMAVLAENGGELTPEIEAKLNQLDVQTAGKIDSYHFMIKRLEAEKEFWEAEADRIYAIAKGCATLAARLKDGVLFAMRQLQVDEISGNAIRAKVSTTKGRLVVDEKLIPQELKMQVVSYVADKDRIREKLEALEDVPGAKIEGGFSIRFWPVKPGGKGE